MKAKLISTTNHGMSHYADIVGELRLGQIARWTGAKRDETFHTSMIVSHEFEAPMLRLHTLNSTYLFEITDGAFDPSVMKPAPQAVVDEFHRRNMTKYQIYWCQITGDALIDHAISVTVLPSPMSLQEARDYTEENMLLDVNGYIVYSIIGAKE